VRKRVRDPHGNAMRPSHRLTAFAVKATGVGLRNETGVSDLYLCKE
jgi:hypothetical protein